MATLLEVSLKQRAVIEFFHAEGETPVNNHKRLQTVYLALSNYHLFGAMKDALEGTHYGNDEVKIAVKNWLHKQPPEFYKTKIHALVQRWSTAIECGGDFGVK